MFKDVQQTRSNKSMYIKMCMCPRANVEGNLQHRWAHAPKALPTRATRKDQLIPKTNSREIRSADGQQIICSIWKASVVMPQD